VSRSVIARCRRCRVPDYQPVLIKERVSGY
jgi:hypothetical protein